MLFGPQELADSELTLTGFVASYKNYAQLVNIDGSTTGFENGIHLVIPSGIISPKTLVSFDFQINAGTGLFFYATNSTGSILGASRFLDKTQFPYFKRVTIPVGTINSGRHYLGLSPSGYSGITEFIIDNVQISAYDSSYLTFTGITTYLHSVGTTSDTSITGVPLARRATTTVAGDFYLDHYPTGSTGYLIRKEDINTGTSFLLAVNASGYPVVEFDNHSMAWSTGSMSDPYYQDGVGSI